MSISSTFWPDRIVRDTLQSRGTRRVVAVLALISVGGLPAAAQRAPAAAQLPAMDTASLGHGPYAEMHTLLEKTIFKVDVLTLEVRVGEASARRLEELIGDRSYSSALADAVAEVAIHTRDAWARIEFKRGVSLDQFVNGSRDNMRRAREAGIITPEDYQLISEGLPRWFAFLDERRIHKGDQIVYRIRSDTLRTQFRAAGGEILLDQTDIGPERRLSVLGSYFARRSDFRKGLIKSLFERGD